MEEIKDIIPLLQYLLNGFVAAWIFYALTSYSKPSSFERIIQALVFTAFTQILLQVFKTVFFYIGSLMSEKYVIHWQGSYETIWSGISAITIGFIFSYFANNDKFHSILRDYKITKQSSYASEWYSAFLEPTYVVLHLDGERRLYGWLLEWPSEADKGHFLITNASWLLDDPSAASQVIELSSVKNILISVADVKMIEFMKP